MSMDFQSAKQEYQRIRAPEELGCRVEAVLARETGRRRGRRSPEQRPLIQNFWNHQPKIQNK